MSHPVCPFCGPRNLEEFSFHKSLAEPGASEYAEVYERVSRIDESLELWQHGRGCRAWLKVRRNPSTGAIFEIALLGGAAP